MTTYTLGRLAKRTCMARSSLLHYETLGLLQPGARSPTGYRLYGEEEIERLRQIRNYRDAGLSLSVIRELLAENAAHPAGDAARLLTRRLLDLHDEIAHLQAQQRHLAQLLARPDLHRRANHWTREEWVKLLRDAGFDEQAMLAWHADFEADDGLAHVSFLRALGLPEETVAKIRHDSQVELERRERVANRDSAE
jgi:MerR family transcriptional regulator, thiopeptide resistance regulator